MGHPARLTVLGSGTSVPLPTRGTSCYLLELGDADDTCLLVDLGPGAVQRAAAAGCDPGRLTGVLLTHVHPDHCADLVALQFALAGPELPRSRGPLRVWAHPELALLNARLRNAWPRWLDPGPARWDWHSVVPGPVALPGLARAHAHVVAHHRSSLGWRLELPNGFVLAFSGDATEGGDLLALARGAQLLVLEAAGPDAAPIDGHLTPRRAGQVAAAAGVEHLLLTHFYPRTLSEPIEPRVREAFEGRLTLAHDGCVLPLSR